MRKQSAVIIFLAFFCLAMSPAPHKPAQIKGKIIDSRTSQPVSGAWIKLLSVFGQLKASVQSDSSGNYQLNIELPRSGSYYRLDVSCQDYYTQSVKRVFTGGKTYVVNFSLKPKPVVTPNNPPQINSVNPPDGSTFLAGTKINIKVNASDADNDPLQYRFSVGGIIKQAWSNSDTYIWQTGVSDTSPAVSITCEVKDNKNAAVSKSLTYHIINPSVNDVLQKTADNYAQIYDMKADMILTSTLNGEPFGETEYCRYYFKAPNKEKTETFSDSTRSVKTDIIIINGSAMHLIDPVNSVKQTVDLLVDAGINSGQFNQLDIYYNQENFLSSHNVSKNNTNTDFNNMIIALDASPKEASNLYSKIELHIDYTKGLVVKVIQNKSEELPQVIEVLESIQMPNYAWVASKIKKNPNLQAGNMLGFINYENIMINSGLSDIDFDPDKQ